MRALIFKSKNKRPEQHTQRAILDYLRMRKIPCWKISTAGIRKPDGGYIPSASVGMADIVGLLPRQDGRMLAIEVKAPKGYLTPAQKTFLAAVGSGGGLAFMARSVQEVQDMLDKEQLAYERNRG